MNHLLGMSGVILAAICAAGPIGAQAAPQVQTGYGLVEGEAGPDGLEVFRGVAYAAAPVGPLRWRAPLPPVRWSGVRAAHDFSPDCPQPPPPPGESGAQTSRGRGQSEDCLTLNIWTTARHASGPLPVMVWIHGGGFQSGSGAISDYDGAGFARAGVVLVTINYRLGPLGFLVHPDLTAEASYHSSGNYGLLDQIAALKWIQQNIAAFGGDARRVTIFGESAGSTAISILQASPLARGLFARVIGESTSQLDAAAGLLGRQSLEQAEQHGKTYAASLGAATLEQLRELPVEALVRSSTFFWPLDPDGYVLPEEVYSAFEHGHQNDVPTLVGSNSAEGVNLRVPWINPDPSEKAAFRRLYPRPDEPAVFTDVVAWQMQSWASLQARTGHSPSYLYLFDHPTPARGGAPTAALHGAEIVYVFRNFDFVPRPWTPADRLIGERMAAYWINFARDGDPNGAGLARWPALDTHAPEVMKFDSDAHAVAAPRQDAFRLIDTYFARRRPPGAADAVADPGILNINLSANGPALAASVPDIALNPRDPHQIAVVWRFVALDDALAAGESGSLCHLSVSTDGGSSFADSQVDWGLPDTPHCNAPFVDFGGAGDLYIGATLVGLNGKPPIGRAVVRRSLDDGRTWSRTVDAIGTDTQERFEPNAAIAQDARYTPWDGARGVVDRETGTVFVSGGYPAPPGGKEHSQRFYTASSDGGGSFGPIRAYGNVEWPQRWDSHLVAAHGRLAFAYIAGAVPQPSAACPCVVFASSADRGTTLQRHFVTAVTQLDTLVHYPALAAHPYLKDTYALALVSEDARQVLALTSSDDGASWKTSIVRQPQDVVRVSRPALAFTPEGALVVLWRGYHVDQSYDVYVAVGAGPEHLVAPVRLSLASSRVPAGLASQYAVRGDFINVVAADSHFVHAAWTDWRNGSASVYYGRVPLARLMMSMH
ncbi:MAG TPA: carboxylesterase family protein [Steroidobacteraceae bacterium]|nr:carboxylesterase family protein [Steroidobacteraceae bacterium]